MSIAENIARVEEQIADACRKARREKDSVRLMAVSKTHSPEAILEAYGAGIRLFGENRVHEYAGKRDALASAKILASDSGARFHCIGPVQSNKVARAARIFDAIDSVDSLRLAEKLNQAAEQAGKTLPILLEIKLSPEDSKHGLAPDSIELEELLERLPHLQHLDPRGLMTIPPYTEDAEEARPYFRRLLALRESLAQRYSSLRLNELSMGMSHDFSVAIEEGTTTVRIGTAIFGSRPPA